MVREATMPWDHAVTNTITATAAAAATHHRYVPVGGRLNWTTRQSKEQKVAKEQVRKLAARCSSCSCSKS